MNRLIISILLLSGCASTGKFVDVGGFSYEPFVVGEGSSKAAANRAAEKAIPAGYEHDWQTSSAHSLCADQEAPVWNKSAQDYACPSGKYRTELGVTPIDPAAKKAFLESRAWRLGKRKKYKGYGESFEIARADLLKKLPKSAVIETWSKGCMVKISSDPVTGKNFCDSQILGNKVELEASVREPNVSDWF